MSPRLLRPESIQESLESLDEPTCGVKAPSGPPNPVPKGLVPVQTKGRVCDFDAAAESGMCATSRRRGLMAHSMGLFGGAMSQFGECRACPAPAKPR